MMKALFSVWTGPCLMKQLADKVREAGLTVACEGTEVLHVESEGTDVDGAAWNILASLCSKHGVDFGFRPKMIRQL